MTHPSEVTISDAEVAEFRTRLNSNLTQGFIPKVADAYREALAAFLAARVPDAPFQDPEMRNDYYLRHDEGFNKCRAAVLKGRG